MATYEYVCVACGPWIIELPIGTADQTSDCPDCAAPGRRRFSPPLLNRSSSPLVRARGREEQSADAPAVTGAVPPTIRRIASSDPRWSALPKP
jgi:putative FmdB family regulatory protein